MDHIDCPEDLPQGSKTAAEEIDVQQILHQLEMILDSKHLRQAKSLEKFLRYVVAKSLAGEEGDLKEYTIGVDVFQRGADYDPRKDAVVRVQANVLRKRLASYYEDEGLLDEIIIEMPKGHYVPQFHRRPLKTDLAVLVPQSTSVALAEVNNSLAIAPRDNSFRWKTAGLVATTFVLGLVTAMLWQSWLGKRVLAGSGGGQMANKTAVDPAYLPLWEKFLEPGAENILAYGTPQFFVADGVYLRDVKINSPQGVDAGSRLMSLQKASRMDFKPAEVYTGVGETHGVHLLTRFFDHLTNNLRVTRSRLIGWSEMKNANVIFLSSMRFHTLAKELPYPSDFDINSGVNGKVINLHPREGEPESYGGSNAQSYAVITVWPGKLQHQRILGRTMILSGSDTWATMAVAEYVTDPEYLRQLNQNLEQCRQQSGHARHAPFFQVLLRADVKDNQPVNISYVTHHDFEIADSTAPGSGVAKAENVARLSAAQK